MIRARFAPSPTGYLHVGGARTALFNWLFCRKHGGRFIIRIEDTDIDRNIAGAEEKLLSDLRWLEIDWDEGPGDSGNYGPYRQSERRELYDAAARKLLATGDAYYAFDTAEELDAMRKQATAEKRSFKYPRPAEPPGEADAARARAEGRPVVVRLRVPDEPITVHDEILGDVSFEAGQIEDLVIVKNNGWPTYHFAVVVDDAAMEISHVLRAQEHLMNTPKHVFIQRALGVATPLYAHLPLVFNIDGTKMSKRDKHRTVRLAVKALMKQGKWDAGEAARRAGCDEAIAARWLDDADAALAPDQLARLGVAAGVVVPEIDVHDFRASGYLPEALSNFVALIGWSPGGDRERLSRDEMVEAFSLERINKTAGRFDREKLLAVNTDYGATATSSRLVAGFRDYAATCGSALAALPDATLETVFEVCKGFRTFRDIDFKVGILFAADDSVRFDAEAVAKVLTRNEGRGLAALRGLLLVLESVEPWTVVEIDGAIKAYCENLGLRMGDAAQPLRVAVTGRTVSPAIGPTLSLLGKARSVARIKRCLEECCGMA